MAISVIRLAQLIVAVVGLIFASSTHIIHPFFVFSFVLALVYEILILISTALGKEVCSNRAELIADIIIAIIVLIATTLVTIDGAGDTMNVLAIVCGFVLPVLLIISAYHGQ